VTPPSLLLPGLDGVLRQFAPEGPVEVEHGLSPGSLQAVAFTHEAGWRETVIGRLPGDDRTAAEAWSLPGEVVKDAVALVRQVRSRCRVALFTNATSRPGRDLSLIGLYHGVDAVVPSARIGVVRPDPEAFRRALRVLQHSPSATLHCDDSAENVDVARNLGIDAVHVPTTSALREALSSRGPLAEQSTVEAELSEEDGVLVVLPDRDDAERVAGQLAERGWSPCHVHRDLLAGEDDADWVVELVSAPCGGPARARMDELDELAGSHGGFATGMT
jgi:FMN phosphatase YigB (HAD superfamily)